MNLEALAQEIEEDAEELISVAKGKSGQVLVVGCSSSEVLGNKIGTGGSMKVAKGLYTTHLAEGVPEAQNDPGRPVL